MAKKIVDITEKLSFDENPVLKVKDVTVEVNSDAATVLKIMGIFSKGASAKDELIFNEKDRKKIDKLNLQFKDFQTIIMAAVDMITGDEEPGEQ